MVPKWHEFVDGVQACPCWQLTQTPVLQTWSEPQVVPFGWLMAASTQTGLPLVQEIVPP